jgi:hypothetical protein
VGIEKLHSANDGEILKFCLDLHEASLLIFECACLVNLDSEHRMCLDANQSFSFFKNSSYAPNSLIRITVRFVCVSIKQAHIQNVMYDT